MNKYIVYDLDAASLNGKAYESLMEFLFSKSDTFTYTKLSTENPCDEEDEIYSENIRKFETLTKSDFRKKISTFHYGISSGNEKQVYVLNLKSGTLKSYIKNKKDITKWNYPECVENIGFYNNSRCVFESCSHEDLFQLYINNEHDIDCLVKAGVRIIDTSAIAESDIPTL